MKFRAKKSVACGLSVILITALIAGCGANQTTGTTPTPSSTPSATASSTPAPETPDAKSYDKFLTIDMFNNQANYQGIQSGWFAKVVKDRFNMEINIIAPNVAGGGDTLFQVRSAAGELGDIVMIGSENGRLADTVKAGLLMDISDLVSKSEYLTQYTNAIDNIKSLISSDKVYAIPSQVSTSSPLTPSEGLDLTYGPYIRWDMYTAIGSPELGTLEDLLPVLKQMQDKFPTSDSGKKTYAISLFKDWDGNMMCLAKQPACFYGVDENGFQLLYTDGRTESIIDDNSLYVRALKFFFSANQMGILDPDSTTHNYETLFAKYQDGQVLFSPWPWLGQAAYNTTEHKAEGKGFMIAPVKDLDIFSYGANPLGNKYVIGVGSKAEDPQRMVDFIDWLYSPEGVMMSSSQTGGTCGPEGLTWEMKLGRPVLTDFGKEAFSGNAELEMPADWGGGTYKDGISQLNFQAVQNIDINPVNNEPYNYALWDSTVEANVTPLDTSWQTFMKANTTLDYLTQHDMFSVAAGNGYIAEAAPSEIDSLRNQIKTIIIENSWKMVFAKNEAEFNSTLKQMQETVIGLGYNQVLEFDQKISDQVTAARKEAAAAYGK